MTATSDIKVPTKELLLVKVTAGNPLIAFA
jgi:hypothetical protein